MLKNHHKKFIAGILAAVTIISAVYYIVHFSSVGGASYTFTQTDWGGGATSTNPVHPTNQTGWTYYESTDIGVATSTTPGEIKLQRVTN